jgi:outer membrane protein assembly factor BamB
LHTLDNPNAYSTSAGDNFGRAISVSQGRAIIAASGEDDVLGNFSGKVYIFDVTTGTLLHTLSNPTAYSTSNADDFGLPVTAVAISGNRAIVGAYNEDDPGGLRSGKAYIFDVDTGGLLHVLDNPNAYSTSASDEFAWAVSISGNYAVVGAYNEDDAGGSISGIAYIFDVESGTLLHTLDNPTAYGTSFGDRFAYSVAIDGNRVIVGAWAEDEAGGSSSGKAYIFDVGTGTLLHTLDNPNYYSTATSDNFGEYVAIRGNYAVVSAATEDDTSGNSSGKAYVFDVANGTLIYALDNPNAYSTSASDNFSGFGLAISDKYIAIGARNEDDPGGATSGKAYIFDVATGALLLTLDNPTAYGTSANDTFASAIGIDGSYVVVGAYLEDEAGGSSSGKAYIFAVDNIVKLNGIQEIEFANGITLNMNHKAFQTAHAGGELIHVIDNPNAYSTSAGDYFGRSAVSISGNRAIVGAYFEDDAGGANSGKAYIFDVTSGNLLRTLDNPNAYSTSANDYFGSAVAIDGNRAIVGAYWEDDAGGAASGKAYIFNVSSGNLLHTLHNPNAYNTSPGDNFGFAVSISGNRAIVGAYGEDDAGGSESGKAYIYDVASGVLLRTLDNPNAYSTSAGDRFGFSVAISGNHAIVGAYQEDDAGGTDSGKAYIFDVNTGALLYTLDNPNAYSTSAGDRFGFSVAISGNRVIVGAYSEDDAGGATSGKAYIFDVTSGSLLHTLDNPNLYSTSANDYFGYSVAISGNRAIVGASDPVGAVGEDDASGSQSGKAYIFDVTTGNLIHILNNPNTYSTGTEDLFGGSVAITDDYAIVDASREDDPGGADSGKAYIFAARDLTYLDKMVTVVS